MRRFLELTWLAIVFCLFWLLPTGAVSYGVEGTLRRVARRSPWNAVFALIASVWKSWEYKSKARFYPQLEEFCKSECVPIWEKLPRLGFVRRGSTRAQTVWEHVQAVMKRFEAEAAVEGFSAEDTSEGLHRILVHELDEAMNKTDELRTKLPHRIADRAAFEESFWYNEDWIPGHPGGVSAEWQKGYLKHRDAVYAYLKEKKGKRFADRARDYNDAFHLGEDRISVLARDCHYVEIVYEGIAEGVTVTTFFREGIGAITNNRMRVEVFRAYDEYRNVSQKPE